MPRKITLTESEFRDIVKECVRKALKETVLGPNDKFTPYSKKDREENFAPYNGKASKDMCKRNPSYAAALKAAEERRKAKQNEECVNESGIEIDPKNKGKFTDTMKRTGKSAEELKHSKNPLTRKRANFAVMAKRGWKPLKKDE